MRDAAKDNKAAKVIFSGALDYKNKDGRAILETTLNDVSAYYSQFVVDYYNQNHDILANFGIDMYDGIARPFGYAAHKALSKIPADGPAVYADEGMPFNLNPEAIIASIMADKLTYNAFCSVYGINPLEPLTHDAPRQDSARKPKF